MSDSPRTPPAKSHFSNLQQWMIGLSVPVVIALLTVLLLPFVEQADEEVELTYGVEITETTGSLINKNIIFTDDDGNRLKCPVPSKSDLKNKAPMQCKDRNGAVHAIEAIKPV
ncbi:hypothetical protein AB0N24_07075 [Arthrobacter sp. NPDC093128]|uniref:hypothetical protein n=1 Tax=Arthrobacter sp. NPDC093128 TaxID=3154979 RepID=UPI00343151CB